MNKFLILILGIALASCVKSRPVQEYPDVNVSRWEKASFTGTEKDPKLWLAKVTVVKTSSNGGFISAGMSSETHLGQFRFTKEKLQFLNAMNPYKNGGNSELELITSWDISHSEYRLAESDGKVTNREEENEYKSFDQKKYFRINWSKNNISESNFFPYVINIAESLKCWSKKSSTIVDNSEDIKSSYVSFTVSVDYEQNTLCQDSLRKMNRSDNTFTVQYKYSFRKYIPNNFKRYIFKDGLSDALMKKYGYLYTMAEYLSDDTKIIKNAFMMNRWNASKTHTFYFSEGFPDKYKWIFADPKVGIIARTNQLFSDHKIALRFEIKNAPKGISAGDIRYSFITAVTEIDDRGVLGVGSSDVDPKTGEVISGNITLWTGDLEFIAKTVKEHYARIQDSKKKSSIIRHMTDALDQDMRGWTETSKAITENPDALAAYSRLLPMVTYGRPYVNIFSTEKSDNSNIQLKDFGSMAHLFSKPQDELSTFVKEGDQVMSRSFKAEFHHEHSGPCLYEMNQAYVDLEKAAAKNLDIDMIVQRLLYRTALHEFGHVLNLRHNFYGSLDSSNYNPKYKKFKTGTSSVMDYLAFNEDVLYDLDWEPYDKAALVYAYSNGEIDLSKNNKTPFLYCTDEHTFRNPLCGKFDWGSTPSEVMLSLINGYEDSYWIHNFRNDRTYWDTSDYPYRVFHRLYKIKQFLSMYTDLTFNTIIKNLSSEGYTVQQLLNLAPAVVDDLKRAIKLSIAFYSAIIKQQNNERMYLNEYDKWTGELQTLGIRYDKLFALRLLMSDEKIIVNPNEPPFYTSYLNYKGEPDWSHLLDKVMVDTITLGPRMEPWFINVGRVLYAINSYNYNNMSDNSSISSIKFSCYKPETLSKKFNINVEQFVNPQDGAKGNAINLDTVVMPVVDSKDREFSGSKEMVGITYVMGNYYVASEVKNPYAFNIINILYNYVQKDDGSRGGLKNDVLELYNLYYLVTHGRIPDCE